MHTDFGSCYMDYICQQTRDLTLNDCFLDILSSSNCLQLESNFTDS